MTEPDPVRVGRTKKIQICRKGNADCVMRCAPEAMNRNTVNEIKQLARKQGAAFNVHRGRSGMWVTIIFIPVIGIIIITLSESLLTFSIPQPGSIIYNINITYFQIRGLLRWLRLLQWWLLLLLNVVWMMNTIHWILLNWIELNWIEYYWILFIE